MRGAILITGALAGIAFLAYNGRNKNNFSDSLVIDDSPIQGKGVFATDNIPAGACLFKTCDLTATEPYRDFSMLGRYLNHSSQPNSIIKRIGNSYYQYAIADIIVGEEITANYLHGPSFIPRQQLETIVNGFR